MPPSCLLVVFYSKPRQAEAIRSPYLRLFKATCSRERAHVATVALYLSVRVAQWVVFQIRQRSRVAFGQRSPSPGGWLDRFSFTRPSNPLALSLAGRCVGNACVVGVVQVPGRGGGFLIPCALLTLIRHPLTCMYACGGCWCHRCLQ